MFRSRRPAHPPQTRVAHDRAPEKIPTEQRSGPIPKEVRPSAQSPAQLSHVGQVLALQQTIGNRAVQRMLSQAAAPQLTITPAPHTATLQRALIDDLPGADSYEAMQALIGNAPRDERRAVLARRNEIIMAKEGLTAEEKSALMGRLLEDSQSWQNPQSYGKTYTGPFADFLAGEDDLMLVEGPMNCWESVLYAAYLNGLDRARIKEWLDNIKGLDWRNMNTGKGAPRLWKALGLGEAQPMQSEDEIIPEPGRLVFYAQLNESTLAEHVVLSIGGGYAMSLAGSGTSVMRIKISDYSHDLKIKVGKKITEVIT